MTEAWKQHWPEYLIEAASLGLFMIAAFTFGTLLEHPASPLHQMIADRLSRRFLMGLAMGATAVTIIYSPWGKQSGAHINPSTTITFFRLGKVAPWDVVFYIIFQFIGGLAGALLASVVLSTWVSHPSVHYVVTTPGSAGAGIAFAAEIGISVILMTVILNVSNNTRWHKFTGLCASVLIATYITFEAPISGMSMNLGPHRCLGPAGAALDRVVDLYHCPPYRHVGGRRSLRANQRHAKRLLAPSSITTTTRVVFSAANRPVKSALKVASPFQPEYLNFRPNKSGRGRTFTRVKHSFSWIGHLIITLVNSKMGQNLT